MPIKKPEEDELKYNERMSRWQQLSEENYERK